MKMRQILAYLGLYSLVAASIIPSAITTYALNLFIFMSVIFLVIAVAMVAGIEETIIRSVAKVKKGDVDSKQYKRDTPIFTVYIPITLIMIACGHWVVGCCWIITGLVVLYLLREVRARLEDEK